MNDNEVLDMRDMVIHKYADGTSAGGFKLDTILTSQDMKGGGSVNKIKELGVPAGLIMIPKTENRNYAEFVNKDLVIQDKLYETLLETAQDKPVKKQSSKRKKLPPTNKTKKRY